MTYNIGLLKYCKIILEFLMGLWSFFAIRCKVNFPIVFVCSPVLGRVVIRDHAQLKTKGARCSSIMLFFLTWEKSELLETTLISTYRQNCIQKQLGKCPFHIWCLYMIRDIHGWVWPGILVTYAQACTSNWHTFNAFGSVNMSNILYVQKLSTDSSFRTG
jgi:hypothetical protein